MTGQLWTPPEKTILRVWYPQGGPSACIPLLPGRTAGAIARQAACLGLRAPGEPRMRRKWGDSNEHFDAEIVRTYQNNPHPGALARLSERLGRPVAWVRRRALHLGVASMVTLRQPPWSDKEESLLEKWAHCTPHVISRKLRAAGFSRTPTAVATRRKRMHIRAEDSGVYSASQVARALGVVLNVVLRWIQSEGLRAHRREGGHVGCAQPTWQVRTKDLRGWLLDHPRHFDLRKVDQLWFLDVLAGRI